MRDLSITKRPLRDDETDILTNELGRFPDVGFIERNRWNDTFPVIYIATRDNAFVGICAAVPLKDWVKIGPIVVLDKYQGKGFGKALFSHVVKKYPGKHLYVGSSNPIVWKFAKQLAFKETGYWKLPNEIKIYLFRYLMKRLSVQFVLDALRKKMIQRTYRYFLKYE